MQAHEQNIVARDAALPGLALLLEPGATLAALRAHWPTRSLSDLQPTYLRYKPGVNCLAAYTLRIEGVETHLHLTAHRVGDEAKLGKVLRQGNKRELTRLEPAVLEGNIALRVFPHDRKLSGLRGLDSESKRETFLARLLPHSQHLWQARLRLLRYKPERRLVARLEPTVGPHALLKLYSPRDFDRALAGVIGISGGAVPTAPLIGQHAEKRALAWAWFEAEQGEGVVTKDLRQAGGVGRLLALLHNQPPRNLRPLTRHEEALPLRAAAEAVAFLLPDIADRVLRIAARLIRDLCEAPPAAAPIHGDFSADQVVFSSGEPKLIDFDEAALGDPAWDLGSFAAQLELEAFRGTVGAAAAASAIRALREGYVAQAGSLPIRTDLYTAAGLLRLAPHAFRQRRPDWAGEMRTLIVRAERLLAAV